MSKEGAIAMAVAPFVFPSTRAGGGGACHTRAMRRLATLVLAVLATSGCYQSHLRDGSGSEGEGGVGGGADGSVMTCDPGTMASARLEPALGSTVAGQRVLLLGASPEPAEDGVRIHLQVVGCSSMPSCDVDLVVSHVGNPMAGIRVPDAGSPGTLSAGRGAIALHVTDERDCAACGGTLDVLGGSLTSGLTDAVTTRVGAGLCTDPCGGTRGLAIECQGASVLAARGPEIDTGPLRVRVASDYTELCTRCRCDAAPLPATGIVVAASGSFAR